MNNGLIKTVFGRWLLFVIVPFILMSSVSRYSFMVPTKLADEERFKYRCVLRMLLYS